jgi:hypothetical protein
MAQFLQSGYKFTWRAGARAEKDNMQPRMLSRYKKPARRHLRSIAVQSRTEARKFIPVQDFDGGQMRVSGCKCFILSLIESRIESAKIVTNK